MARPAGKGSLIRELLKDGKSYTEIEEEVGCSKSSVSYQARKLSLPPRGGVRIWNDEQLKAAVPKCQSLAEVLKELGVRPAGGTQKTVKCRIETLNLSTEHFMGQSWRRGLPSERRFSATEVLKVYPEGGPRPRRKLLYRSLLEIGVPYECAICSQGPEWMGGELVLPIDHISGNRRDNRQENLRFLCPNCHTQTETFGYRGREDENSVAEIVEIPA